MFLDGVVVDMHDLCIVLRSPSVFEKVGRGMLSSIGNLSTAFWKLSRT